MCGDAFGMLSRSGMNHRMGLLSVESGWPLEDILTGIVDSVLNEGSGSSATEEGFCAFWSLTLVWMWQG